MHARPARVVHDDGEGRVVLDRRLRGDDQLVRRALGAVERVRGGRSCPAVPASTQAAADCCRDRRRGCSATPRAPADQGRPGRSGHRGRSAARTRTWPGAPFTVTEPTVIIGPSARVLRLALEVEAEARQALGRLVGQRHVVSGQEHVRGGVVDHVHVGMHAGVAAVAGLRVHVRASRRQGVRAGRARRRSRQRQPRPTSRPRPTRARDTAAVMTVLSRRRLAIRELLSAEGRLTKRFSVLCHQHPNQRHSAGPARGHTGSAERGRARALSQRVAADRVASRLTSCYARWGRCQAPGGVAGAAAVKVGWGWAAATACS